MSQPPPQRGHPALEWPHIDPAARTQHRGPIPLPYPYRQEPRQDLPQREGYESTAHYGPRFPAFVPERHADPRYQFSPDNAYINFQPIQQALPLRTYHKPSASSEAWDHYNPYEERINPALGPARDYESRRSRTYDVESQ
ncbi:hypothetical protein N7461_000975 [Penicillium sp. DV-2018c]|nr:hypothetical protein N7461_000975 [Penicillium sp. DV-2018c]